MKVTIEHTTTKVTMLSSAPAIALTVQFSEEELAVIKQSGLSNYVFHDAPLHPKQAADMHMATPVKFLMMGKTIYYPYTDLAAARVDEIKIKESLKTLKGAIEANAAPLKQKDTFEL